MRRNWFMPKGLATLLAPLLFGILYALSQVWWILVIPLGLVFVSLLVLMVSHGWLAIAEAMRANERAKRRAQPHVGGRGEPLRAVGECVPSREASDLSSSNGNVAPSRNNVSARFPSQEPSTVSGRGTILCDRRFALIDSEGERRYPQLIDGTFQIGKSRDALPRHLSDFARAVLCDGRGGRFTRADGSKRGILGYGGKSREAVAYELDGAIAQDLGIPIRGKI